MGLEVEGASRLAEGELHRGESFEFKALNISRLRKVIFSLCLGVSLAMLIICMII